MFGRRLLVIAIIPILLAAGSSLAFSAWAGKDMKYVTATAGIIKFKETGQIEVMNDTFSNYFTVIGPNNISHSFNGMPPGTDGKLGTVYSVNNAIVYNVTILNITPGEWVKIQFNITSLSDVAIYIGPYQLEFSPNAEIFEQIPSNDFLPTGIFGSNGAYWLYNISDFHPGIMNPNPHHQFTFKFWFGLASNAPVAASGESVDMSIVIPVSA
jgi:hypothetical protein